MPATNAAQILRKSGVLLIGAALLSAQAAWLHMRGLAQAYGEICGSGAGLLAHCPACYASGALFASAAVSFVLAQSNRSPASRACALSSPSVRSEGLS
jgi:hypothetical protein